MKLAPDDWPSPPKLPDDPHRYRLGVLSDNRGFTPNTLQRLLDDLAFYPEVHVAVLELLSESPSVGLMRRMAEAIMEEYATPGENVSDADRIRSINAAEKALKAAAKIPSRDEKDPPF